MMRNSTEHARSGQSIRPALPLILAIASFGLCGCNTFRSQGDAVTDVTAPTTPAADEEDTSFKYCPIETVSQTSSTTNGLAALASVMQYWEQEVDVPTLEANFPAKSETGYPLLQLRRIATKEGLIAFALTMKDRPLEQVSEQLENGRPIIVPVHLPDGRPAAPPTPTNDPGATAPATDPARPHRYVVIFGQSHDQFLLMDPAKGIVKLNKQEFTNYWAEEKFAALLCSSF